MSEIVDVWTIGQCVYTMRDGKRCRREAILGVKYGLTFDADPPAYGYCLSHAMMVTKPRDPRIHPTAEPLAKIGGE